MGVFFEFFGAFRSTKLGLEIRAEIVFFFSSKMSLRAPMLVFICFRCSLGLILRSQTDSPTSENVGFTIGIPLFLFKDFNFFDVKMVLRVFWDL